MSLNNYLPLHILIYLWIYLSLTGYFRLKFHDASQTTLHLWMSIAHLTFVPPNFFSDSVSCVALGLPGIHRDPPAYAFQGLSLQAYPTKPFKSPFVVIRIGDECPFMPIQYFKQNLLIVKCLLN